MVYNLIIHTFIILIFSVAPTDDDLDSYSTKKPNRMRLNKFNSKTEKDEETSPDPLEPWSTKDLLNINKILES